MPGRTQDILAVSEKPQICYNGRHSSINPQLASTRLKKRIAQMKTEHTAYSAARIKFLQDSLASQDPTTMGVSEAMRRSILTGRLTAAFEAGWNARDKQIPPSVPTGDSSP